tara:strand:- start:157 stop:1578 length:1422 start_codon:yes stop_codon:yes gene_type:complete
MKKKNKILIIIVFILIAIFLLNNRTTTLSFFKYYAPQKIGEKVKEIVNIFSLYKDLKEKHLNLQIRFNNIIDNEEKLPIYSEDEEKIVKIADKEFYLKTFSIPFFLTSKNLLAETFGSFYMDFYKKDLFVVSGNGLFSYINIDEFKKKESELITITTNIKKIIKYNEFYTESRFGVKDLLIIDDEIYISYIKSINGEKDCFNTSILKAKINFKKIEFKEFFTGTSFVCKSYVDFNAHSSGGRIVNYDDDNILLSTGEFLDRTKAQNLNNTLGKIIKINKKSSNYEIISFGHRNVQGLFFNKNNNTIYSSEHGPDGGDEININNLDEKKLPKNFGWPIASYGEHYGGKSTLNKLTRYIKSPLLKSHNENGFIEPLRYFVPSIGISEIIGIDLRNESGEKNINILASSLGWTDRGGMSLYYMEFENNKLKYESVTKIFHRIRDMIYKKSSNTIFVSLQKKDSLPKIGILYQKMPE